ncbi:MAG: M15 family metallopeptidase [Marinifilum sp.]|jgi:peptidoglycan L-alanyl-D-glutamate endopeptidase CwlK|nr:M15 family metallopeptidase [Marinifilum sp.]
MYKFGKQSKVRLAKVHHLLQELAYATIKKSEYDFGIPNTGGLRTAEMQKELYDKGYSKLDGYKKKSYHQTGLALDMVPYIEGKYTWQNKTAFLHIARTAFEVWNQLENHQGLFLHWGGFWRAKDLNDNNLLDLDDKLGWDLPHFELRNKAQANAMDIAELLANI